MSWMITRRSDGTVREIFDAGVLSRIDRSKYTIETAEAYLARLNENVRKRETNGAKPACGRRGRTPIE